VAHLMLRLYASRVSGPSGQVPPPPPVNGGEVGVLPWNTNFRFSYTKLWGVFVWLWGVFVWFSCFALELALEGPPDPLADGHPPPHG
jgi:hypothetical protein